MVGLSIYISVSERTAPWLVHCNFATFSTFQTPYLEPERLFSVLDAAWLFPWVLINLLHPQPQFLATQGPNLFQHVYLFSSSKSKRHTAITKNTSASATRTPISGNTWGSPWPRTIRS